MHQESSMQWRNLQYFLTDLCYIRGNIWMISLYVESKYYYQVDLEAFPVLRNRENSLFYSSRPAPYWISNHVNTIARLPVTLEKQKQ